MDAKGTPLLQRQITTTRRYLDTISSDVQTLIERADRTDVRLQRIEETMVTKEYLDTKLESYVTKEYLDAKLERFATKDDLADLAQHFVVVIEESIQAALERVLAMAMDNVDKEKKE